MTAQGKPGQPHEGDLHRDPGAGDFGMVARTDTVTVPTGAPMSMAFQGRPHQVGPVARDKKM